MVNIILLIVCFLAGVLLRRTGRFPAATPAALNGFVIHVSLPALALLHIHNLQLDRTHLYSAAMPWLLFGAGVRHPVVFHYPAGVVVAFARGLSGILFIRSNAGLSVV